MATLIVTAIPIDDDWRSLDPRVVAAIKGCDLLIAEERKTALRILAATECRERPVALINEHSTDASRDELLQQILAVDTAVLISDAGTPCIADPDYRLVDLCIERGVAVRSVSGASSIITALSVSGFPAHQFIFLGFPPREEKARKRFFAELRTTKITAVFLERPYSLRQTLSDMIDFTQEVSISIALGMAAEQNVRGVPHTLIERLDGIKAAFAVVVGGEG
jgi:16S rRNA (cytidine1402-2'-O)-methyltransferase